MRHDRRFIWSCLLDLTCRLRHSGDIKQPIEKALQLREADLSISQPVSPQTENIGSGFPIVEKQRCLVPPPTRKGSRNIISAHARSENGVRSFSSRYPESPGAILGPKRQLKERCEPILGHGRRSLSRSGFDSGRLIEGSGRGTHPHGRSKADSSGFSYHSVSCPQSSVRQL